MLNFKIQSSKGKENISLSEDQPFGVFAEMISIKSQIPLDRLVLTTAFPPLVLMGKPEEKLKDLTALKSGSVISAREGDSPSLHRQGAAASAATASAAATSSPPAATTTASPNVARPAAAIRTVTHSNVTALISMGFDPICAERSVEIAGDDLGLAVEVCQELMSSSATTTGSSHGTNHTAKIRTIVRRVIDADNSCLFNSLGYLMVRDKKGMNHVYRQLIASEIQGDPIKYSTEVLEGKSTEEYVAWIMNVDKWGGEIEMSTFPKHLGVEIAAVDVQTGHVYVYGEEFGYSDRVYLLYDGVHYDAIVSTLVDPSIPSSSNEEDDITVFSPNDRDIIQQIQTLATELRQKKQYVNLLGCDIQCLICKIGLKGQAGATEHAKQTGHQNFSSL